MTVPKLLFLVLLSAAAGCGQKGPLYLPGHEPPSMRVRTPKKTPAAPQKSREPAPEEQENH